MHTHYNLPRQYFPGLHDVQKSAEQKQQQIGSKRRDDDHFLEYQEKGLPKAQIQKEYQEKGKDSEEGGKERTKKESPKGSE